MSPPAFPAVYLDARVLVAQKRFIGERLRRYRVRSAMLEDLTQEVLLGAWSSMAAGRFRPDPAKPLNGTLRSWLAGICYRQANKLRERLWFREEIPAGEAWGLCIDQGPTPELRAEMRAILRACRYLPRIDRDVLGLAALGATTAEMAAELDIPEGTAGSRLRHARQNIARRLRKRP